MLKAKLVSTAIAGAIGAAGVVGIAAASPSLVASSAPAAASLTLASSSSAPHACPEPGGPPVTSGSTAAPGSSGSTHPVSVPAGKCDPQQIIQALVARANTALQKINDAIAKGTAAEPKIQAIIAKVGARGVDTSSAQQTFSDFENQLAAAQQAVQPVPGLIGQVSPTNIQADKPLGQQVRSDLLAARNDLKAAWTDLKTLRSDWQSLKSSAGSGGGSTGSGGGSTGSGAPGAAGAAAGATGSSQLA